MEKVFQYMELNKHMTDFIKIGSIDAFKPDTLSKVIVGDEEVLIVKTNEKICAISNLCSHRQGDLSLGQLENNTVICPKHGSKIDFCSGEALTPPAHENQIIYDVKIVGSEVQIKAR